MLYNKEWEKPAVKLEPWQEHLLAAAQYIRDHGWCQRASYEWNNSACVMGALNSTKLPGMRNHGATATKFALFLGLPGNSFVAAWNDAPGRTKEEVIAALEAAAKGE